MVEFGTSTLVQYFMHILAKFNTFSRSLWPNVAEFNSTLFQYLCGQMWPNSIQYFFNTAWEPCFWRGRWVKQLWPLMWSRYSSKWRHNRHAGCGEENAFRTIGDRKGTQRLDCEVIKADKVSVSVVTLPTCLHQCTDPSITWSQSFVNCSSWIASLDMTRQRFRLRPVARLKKRDQTSSVVARPKIWGGVAKCLILGE